MRPEDEAISFKNITNPQWVDDARQAIVCEVEFSHLQGPEKFVARADDPMPYGREIFALATSGKYGELTITDPDRLEGLPKPENGSVFLVGDIFSAITDPIIVGYLKRHNTENHSGSETSTVIVWGNILDDCLRRVLDKQGVQTKRYTFSKKIDKVRVENFVDSATADKLELVREIRNEFAHDYATTLDGGPQQAACDTLVHGVEGISRRLKFTGACCDLMIELHKLTL